MNTNHTPREIPKKTINMFKHLEKEVQKNNRCLIKRLFLKRAKYLKIVYK